MAVELHKLMMEMVLLAESLSSSLASISHLPSLTLELVMLLKDSSPLVVGLGLDSWSEGISTSLS
jgi:hypothetical protein